MDIANAGIARYPQTRVLKMIPLVLTICLDTRWGRVYTQDMEHNRQTDPIAVHAALVNAVTEFDRAQSTRQSYNRYALSMYLQACQSVESYMRETPAHGVRESILRYFVGRLQDRCLAAVGESPSTKPERMGGW